MEAKDLVEELRRQGIRDETVLDAIERTPRHLMVPESVRDAAWENHPLPIGQGQTISQPYIVAWMTEAAEIEPGENVLEVGTGSGYQAAVIAEILGLGPGDAGGDGGGDAGDGDDRAGDGGEGEGSLATIEIVPELGRRAKRTLEEIGYRDIAFRIGDGYAGWSERAPFDAIVVTAAPGHVPPELKAQLAVGGRLVIPVGEWAQELLVITRTEDGFDERRGLAVRFVPMTGEAQRRGSSD